MKRWQETVLSKIVNKEIHFNSSEQSWLRTSNFLFIKFIEKKFSRFLSFLHPLSYFVFGRSFVGTNVCSVYYSENMNTHERSFLPRRIKNLPKQQQQHIFYDGMINTSPPDLFVFISSQLLIIYTKKMSKITKWYWKLN